MLDFFTVPRYNDGVNRKEDFNKSKLLPEAGHA